MHSPTLGIYFSSIPNSSPSPLFAIGQRIGFRHGKRKTSAVIYDVGPTMYCVTAWFGKNHVNLGIDHDDAWLANDLAHTQKGRERGPENTENK